MPSIYYKIGNTVLLSGGKTLNTSFCLSCIQISAGGVSSHNNRFKQVWGWGDNVYGQLGDDTITLRLTPVSILGVKKTFCKISTGLHTTTITHTGQVWCWGYNGQGQLGDDTATDRCVPVLISGSNKTFCKIDNDGYHTVGIDNRGQVWCWGYNGQGQLGDNTVTSRRTPVSILGANKTFCEISVGDQHTMSLTYTGQVWGWGYNGLGQLGDNSITSRRTPVSIKGAKKTFCKISTGDGYYTMGLTYTGQVWGWGYNTYGGLGDNSITRKRTPVSIFGAKKTFCKIDIGYHTVGIDYNGQVWGWGYNLFGGIGDGTIISRRTPVSIKGAKKTFCEISTGTFHTIGLTYNGQIWSWGDNSKGQLGQSVVVVCSTTPLRVYNF